MTDYIDYVVYAVFTESEFSSGDNDAAEWFNACGTALEYAVQRAIDDSVAMCIMKFVNRKTAWDFAIEVDETGNAWSEDWSARNEIGRVQRC